jgi:hypothetical protein
MKRLLIGIYIKENNKFHFTKPLNIIKDYDHIYCSINRDIDYSLLLNKDESFELGIIEYNKYNDYYELNNNNLLNNDINVIMTFNNLNISINNILNNKIYYTLNNEYDIKIDFSIFYLYYDKYIITTPHLSFTENLLQ